MIPRKLIRPIIAVGVCVFFYAFIWTNLPIAKFRNLKNQLTDNFAEVVIRKSLRAEETQPESTKPVKMEVKTQHSAENLPRGENSNNKADGKKSDALPTNKSTVIMTANKKNPTQTKKVNGKVATSKSTRITTKKIKGDQNGDLTEIPPMQKNDFKKAPTWDFEEKYLRDLHPRITTCKQSLRNSKDQDFQKSFIPDIQVFMQKDHLNISVWNRLAHFNNPFGFMGYNFSVVKESVKLIPDLKDFQLLPVPKTEKEGCIRCAVVGTGGILNGSRKGKEIDSHDYVFRMNGAVLKGFEEDVGNKTSVYVHTAHSLTSVRYTLKKYGFTGIPADEGIKYVFIPEGLRDYYWLEGLMKKDKVPGGQYRNSRPLNYYPPSYNESRFYVVHPDFLRYVRIRFMLSKQLAGPHWKFYRPTNGAFTMFLALHSCDIVDAYGFITEDHKKYNNYYYERDSSKKTKVIFYINHDYNLEIKLWKKLHDTNIIKLYQGEGQTQENGKNV
ncbi:hypothetical protein GJAV_G00267620 [Gymnothorax javanicus]|nr:hypothetical protein GJAV_G00267620 [Gymnothorax javanicus]